VGIDVARLADHAAAANEGDCAFRYGQEAGRAAADVGAHREAVHHYRTALRFASSHSAAERAELLDALAAECMVTDQNGRSAHGGRGGASAAERGW
jgi:hypothetical protein